MKKKKLLLTIFVSLTILASCKKTESDPNCINELPNSIGTEWIYEKTTIVNKLESELTRSIIDSDTIKTMITLKIESDSLFNGSIIAKQYTVTDTGFKTRSVDYLYGDSEGLKNIASSDNRSILSVNPNILNTYKLNAIPNIDNQSVTGVNRWDINKGSIIQNSTHYLEIQLPLNRNSNWDYLISPNLTINKKVVSFENTDTDLGVFNCYKIEISFISKLYNDIKVFDWISKEGLIKRTIDHGIIIQYVDTNLVGIYQVSTEIKIREIHY